MTISLWLAGAEQAMAQRTWNGGGADTNWATPANWVENTTPSGNIGAVTFSGNTRNTSNNNIAGLSTAAFSFTNDGTTGKTNGFVLNGSSITLAGGSAVNTTPVTDPANAITDTIDLNLVLGVNLNFNILGNHHLTINGNISQSGSDRGIQKQEAGTLTLTGDNSLLTAFNFVNGGTLSINAISDTGVSNIGKGNIRLGNANIAGTLNYTGSGTTTVRTLQIGNGSGGGANGGATITANGSNGGTGLKFTAANFTTQDTSSVVASRTLLLSGSNTDDNTVSGVIANTKTGTTATNIQKSGSGRWILGGANTYTGSVGVSAGVLQLNHTSAVSGGLATAATTNTMTLNGGVLGLGAGDMTRSLGTGAGQIQITASNSGFAAYGADRAVNMGGVLATLTWGSGSFFSAASTTMTLSDASATHTLDFQNPIHLNGADRTFFVGDGAVNVDAILSGVISGSGNGFVKSGPGTLLISAINTYTGPTTVTGGTLRLGASDTLPDTSPLLLNAGSLNVSTFADDAGTLDVIGATSINIGSGGAMAFADSSTIAWTGGTLNITGSVVSASSIRFGTTTGGLTSTQLGLITINGIAGIYTLDENGYLFTTVDEDPFLTWSGGGFAADTNNDGVQNGLAWLLGAPNPSVDANSFLPIFTETGGNLNMTFDMLSALARDGAQMIVEYSSDLGVADPWTEMPVPDVTSSTGPVTFAVSGTNPLHVEVAISSTEAASGRLFARLRAVKIDPPSTQFFEQGTSKLVIYTDVPGRAPSDQYRIRVKSAATNHQWKSVFAMRTVAANNGALHYNLVGWTHTYANIEMSENSPVEVEISKFNGDSITKGVTRPEGKTKGIDPLKPNDPVTFRDGKAYFTMNQHAQVTLDVNGQMDEQNTGISRPQPYIPSPNSVYENPDIHCVSIFANPLLLPSNSPDDPALPGFNPSFARPEPNGPGVYAVAPGAPLPDPKGPWTTLYFLPGEHTISGAYQVRKDRRYYIPGDAIVFGAFANDTSVWGAQSSNIRFFGYGTISGEKHSRDTSNGQIYEQITPIGMFTGVRNTHVNGITIIDPSNHAVHLANPDRKPQEPNTFKWVKIITWRANGDGLNPYGNTKVEDSFFRTQDDSLYVNGWGFERLVIWNDANGGSFIMSNMPSLPAGQNLIVKDCDVIYSRARYDNWGGGRVFTLSAPGGGAAGSGVIFENIDIEDPRPTLAAFNMSTSHRGAGDISRVIFRNVTMRAPISNIASAPFRMQSVMGALDKEITGFEFDNVTIGGVKITSENFSSYFDTNEFVDVPSFQFQ